MPVKYKIHEFQLSKREDLRTLVESRKAYTLQNCELNIFETYQRALNVPLSFNDLVITSMLRGKKVMHLFDKPGFDYLPGETVVVPPRINMLIDFPEASDQEPTQCTALAIDRKQILDTINYLNEHYPREDNKLAWQLNFERYHFYNNEELAALINKLMAIGRSDNVSKDVLADLAMKELIIRIMQLQNLYLLEDVNANEGGRMGYVIRYIRENLTERISVDELSKKANMSKPSFFRLFKHEIGISPVEYIIRERINRAKQYLSASKSVKEACFASGFNDLNYFIRIFKKHEGITPGGYRCIC